MNQVSHSSVSAFAEIYGHEFQADFNEQTIIVCKKLTCI